MSDKKLTAKRVNQLRIGDKLPGVINEVLTVIELTDYVTYGSGEDRFTVVCQHNDSNKRSYHDYEADAFVMVLIPEFDFLKYLEGRMDSLNCGLNETDLPKDGTTVYTVHSTGRVASLTFNKDNEYHMQLFLMGRIFDSRLKAHAWRDRYAKAWGLK